MATHQALLPVEKVQFLLASVEANGLPASFPIWQVGCHVVIEVEGQRRQTTTVPPSSHSNAEWDVNFPFTADRTALISIRIYQSYAVCLWRRRTLFAESVATVEELVQTCSGRGHTVFTIPMGQQKAACPTVTIALKVQHVVATEKDTLGAPGSTDGMSNEGSSQLTLTNVAIEGQLANDGVGPHDARGSIEKLDEGEHQSIHAGHVSGAPSHTIDSTLSLNVTDQENTRKDDVADGNSTLTLQSTGDETRSYTSRESTRSSKEGGQQSIHSDDGGNSQSNPTVGDDGSSKVSGKSVKSASDDQRRGTLGNLSAAGYRNVSRLSYAANMLFIRFYETNDVTYLDQAIEQHHAALASCPHGHPDLASMLSGLAVALNSRFNLRGALVDLDEAIKCNLDALQLRKPGHPQRSMTLSNLAVALTARFKHRGDIADLVKAIEYNRAALELRPEGNPDRSMTLSNLAVALTASFNKRGEMADLEEAIDCNRAALQLRPPGHPERSMTFSNLAVALYTRFQQIGDVADLEEAIERNRASLMLRPPGHPERSMTLSNLAVALYARFNRHGETRDLEESIEHNRAALQLRPVGHPERSMTFSNLAVALYTRFKQAGDVVDLKESIEYNRAALDLRPEGHTERSMTLSNLAAALSAYFKQQGDLDSLQEAIECNRASLELRPPGHPDRSMTLSNLAVALYSRFTQLHEVSDLQEAIECHRGALQLRPRGHPERCRSLNYLATTLSARFERLGDAADLASVFDLLGVAQDETVAGHPILLDVHSTLASTYLLRYSVSKEPADLSCAFKQHESAATFASAGSWRQFQAAQCWIKDAEQHSHVSSLDAYRNALNTLNHYITAASSVVSRHELVKRATSTLASDAASCAARHNDPAAAVQFLEQGRALTWTHMAHLRTPLDQLRSAGGDALMLANEFQRLSSQLNTFSDGSGRKKGMSADEEARHHHELKVEWDFVVARIRQLEGFSRFLMAPLYADLQEAAREGPVILVNASRFSCDAFIVQHAGKPIHVPLPHITFEDVSTMSADLARLMKSSRECTSEREAENQLIRLLREVWNLVVCPVVDQLLLSPIPVGSRIWWCPTSKFTSLPLHAAGPYRKGSLNLSHHFISSYTPTLSALIRTRRTLPAPSPPPRFAAIGQEKPGGGNTDSELHSANTELDLVHSFVPADVPFVQLSDSAATRDAALHALDENNWVHLACHGLQDAAQPFASRFSMYDGPLSLLDIIRANLKDPRFAFLSACHTAVGDETTPDEVIHLAAAMQFAGFQSVIGTMWGVDDSMVHHMVSAFYENFMGERMDCTKAAEALVIAARNVMKKKVPLYQRIVFIHIGA